MAMSPVCWKPDWMLPCAEAKMGAKHRAANAVRVLSCMIADVSIDEGPVDVPLEMSEFRRFSSRTVRPFHGALSR